MQLSKHVQRHLKLVSLTTPMQVAKELSLDGRNMSKNMLIGLNYGMKSGYRKINQGMEYMQI